MTTLLYISAGLTLWCGMAILAYALCVSAARGDKELEVPLESYDRDMRFGRGSEHQLRPLRTPLQPH